MPLDLWHGMPHLLACSRCVLCARCRSISPIVSDGPPNFWVEVWNDDDTHFIRLYSFGRFEPALKAWETLVADRPAMRVVMRHFAHVYRNYIPARLDNSRDRDREYPSGSFGRESDGGEMRWKQV